MARRVVSHYTLVADIDVVALAFSEVAAGGVAEACGQQLEGGHPDSNVSVPVVFDKRAPYLVAVLSPPVVFLRGLGSLCRALH
jgi:hypothetical protein